MADPSFFIVATMMVFHTPCDASLPSLELDYTTGEFITSWNDPDTGNCTLLAGYNKYASASKQLCEDTARGIDAKIRAEARTKDLQSYLVTACTESERFLERSGIPRDFFPEPQQLPSLKRKSNAGTRPKLHT